MTSIVCPIWGTPAKELSGYEGRDGIAVDSPRAGGRYFISRSAQILIGSLSDNKKVALTHEIVSNNALGSIANVSTETVKSISDKLLFKPKDRADRLLEYLISCSKFLGHKIIFETKHVSSNDPNIIWWGTVTGEAANPLFAWSDSLVEEEVWFLLEMLAGQKLIASPTGSAIDEITVLPAGYARFEQAISAKKTDQAFVAMWFDPSMQDAYEIGVEGAVRASGYRPLRIDRKEHNNRIDDEIIAEIRRSKFLVADFTSEIGKPRGGVYFEAGFAFGLGIPVIWTCRSDLLADIHFDTRQFNHIVWESPSELETGLRNRILATIGAGPLSSEN